MRDLSQADFILREDGVPQAIDRFTAVSLEAGATGPGASDVVTNTSLEPSQARLYTLLLDDLQIARANRDSTVELAETFIERHLGPNDLVEIASTSGSLDLRAAFTSDRQLLLSVVRRFVGRRPDSFRDAETVQAARAALRTLEMVANRLGTITGTGKRLLFVSEGIAYDYQSDPGDEGSSAISHQLRAAIGAATRGNVTIYSLDASGFTGDDSPMGDSARDSLHDIAAATGGVSFLTPFRQAEAFERIVQRSSHYYLLGYQPNRARAEGKHRSLAIKVVFVRA